MTNRPTTITVLMVAYHFPPIGGGGVQRAVKFARYFPEFGVNLVVLTGPGRYDNLWTPEDSTMLAEVENVPVFRASELEQAPKRRARARLERTLGLRTPYIRWWIDQIVRVGEDAGKGADVILAELVPYEAAFGVEELARRLKIPWVADLQDPWALDEMWLYPSVVHRLADRARMRKTLRTAAAVVMNTPEASARLVDAFPEFRNRSVSSIPNGFDAADFEGDIATPASPEVFRIVHSGYLHTEQGLRHRKTRRLRRLTGGMPIPTIDFLTRSHLYLLQALDQVLQDDPGLRGLIEVCLVGEATRVDRELAARYPFVNVLGYRSHAESVSLLRGANLLFLPMHDLPPGTRAGLVPGKTYEYLASGIPILAAVPDGDARDILLKVGTASICRPADVEGLAQAIREHVAAWKAGRPRPVPSQAVIGGFERRKLTSDMATLLREVVERSRPESTG